MADFILDGESGASVRAKLNAMAEQVNRLQRAATKAALATFLAANAAAANPHSQGAMSSPPTITVAGAGSNAAPPSPYTALTQQYLHLTGTLDTVSLARGGKPKTFGTDYRRYPCATEAATGGNSLDGENSTSWRQGITTNAAQIAWCVNGGGSANFRFIVNGQYASLTATSVATGGRQYVVLDFGSAATRTVYIEGDQASSLKGVNVGPSDTISKPANPFPSIAFGDSFTAGTAADYANDGFAPVLADYLGTEIWASGVGGTGYVNDATTKFKLRDRITADLNRFIAQKGAAPSVVYVPMGVNDVGMANIQTEASACYDIIRALCPGALVVVIGPWDTAAPSPPVSNYAAAKAAIVAAIGSRDAFYFLDMEGVAFVQVSGIHPGAAGHLVLGQNLNTRVRALMAAA